VEAGDSQRITDGKRFVQPEDEAKLAAEAAAYEMNNATGTFNFTGPGMPDAFAEADVVTEGYGYPIDGGWKAETVRKTVTVRDGFMCTISVKAGNEAKANGQESAGQSRSEEEMVKDLTSAVIAVTIKSDNTGKIT
jgi:phage protein D